MKVELLFVTVLILIVFYEGYLKGPIQMAYSYYKVIVGLFICAYLGYAYYTSKAHFAEALDFIRGVFLPSAPSLMPALGIKKQRNVSQLLKKKVAAKQKWACGHCRKILDASYEVDHIVALYKGGTNDEDNLIALCRNCHGIKTVDERLA
jgi:hypothetical protein